MTSIKIPVLHNTTFIRELKSFFIKLKVEHHITQVTISNLLNVSASSICEFTKNNKIGKKLIKKSSDYILKNETMFEVPCSYLRCYLKQESNTECDNTEYEMKQNENEKYTSLVTNSTPTTTNTSTMVTKNNKKQIHLLTSINDDKDNTNCKNSDELVKIDALIYLLNSMNMLETTMLPTTQKTIAKNILFKELNVLLKNYLDNKE
jgi:hypothetical protein